MPASYDDAVTELYQVPHAAFVTERKRLAGELKATGDKDGAARLAKLPRPPVSAWVVNQLWWHDRDELEAMLATAERLRAGDLGAAAAHRDAIAKLRARASAILADAGHGASEAILRRVTTTLAAIAAAGGFAPDPPGALADDRDPPGFETMGLAAAAPRPAAKPSAGPAAEDAASAEAEEDAEAEEAEDPEEAAAAAERRAAEDRRRAAAEAQQRTEAAAERRRLEQEAARRQAERERVLAALRTAVGEVDRQQRDLEKLRASVTAAEDRLQLARAIVADLEAKLAELPST